MHSNSSYLRLQVRLPNEKRADQSACEHMASKKVMYMSGNRIPAGHLSHSASVIRPGRLHLWQVFTLPTLGSEALLQYSPEFVSTGGFNLVGLLPPSVEYRMALFPLPLECTIVACVL